MSPKQHFKRFIPSAVYPEILVVIGHDLVRLLHRSIYESVPYILAFWNSVDMLYRNLEHPKYRLNIAAILVAQDPQALEYITKSIYNDQKLDLNKTFVDFGKWLFKQDQYIPVNNYDAAITMTSHKLDDGTLDDSLNQFVAGIAYISSICNVSTHEKDMRKTGIVYDNGGFSGISTAAHELGHLLGARHDSCDHCGCRDDLGYIMATFNSVTNNSADWSNCSLLDFHSFLESKTSDPTCIFNIPNQAGDVIPRYLSGNMMDANTQCQMKGATHARIDETTCQKLICVTSHNRLIINDLPAADGTSCGIGKLCLHHQCISENEIN
ncbi:hypothetical protein PV328_005361 [Microctonus aethiopoides]|uniref:Peptidase M12B domain-containing protein n=1 Tax=Microctonus aethiopoides TaxID=144406 RepID=A0AA39FLY4_9HYME|nr:hypothetical protein PV328_005361 [Microctonus aethiopoides]